jgi:hypothetical protein
VISDAHEGIKAAVAKVLNATWLRCRVRFMRGGDENRNHAPALCPGMRQRLNGEIKGRTEVVGIFAMARLIGAILLEQR